LTRTDEITLTLPADRDFYRVAHLVLGGLAVRLNLTFEHLEDLQLALDGLLDTSLVLDDDVTVRVRVAGPALETDVGPFRRDRIGRELARSDGDVGLRRILDTVVDSVQLDERGGEQWVRLTKRVEAS
jgi:hypothetical protein